LAGLQSFVNDPASADAVTELNGLNVDPVFDVRDSNLVGALQLGHGAVRDEQRALFGSGGGANPALLSGAQEISETGKNARYANGTSALIDLPIREVERPVVRIDVPSAKMSSRRNCFLSACSVAGVE
jgi:hypothetical protein